MGETPKTQDSGGGGFFSFFTGIFTGFTDLIKGSFLSGALELGKSGIEWLTGIVKNTASSIYGGKGPDNH